MAVRIRLARRGRKKLAMYDIVVADARAPRDGRFIEKLGNYNPNTNPATIKLDTDRALYWVMTGAQPTETARSILSRKGVMLRKHLQVGVNKGAITQEEADKRFAAWLKDKEAREQAQLDKLAKEQAEADKARLAAESKVNEARAAEILKKQSEMLAAEKAAEEAAASEEAEAPADDAAAEAPAEESVAEEAPAIEAKEKAPAAEAEEPAAETPAAEAEAPAAEAKEEAPAAEAEEAAEAKEEAKEETPAEEESTKEEEKKAE